MNTTLLHSQELKKNTHKDLFDSRVSLFCNFYSYLLPPCGGKCIYFSHQLSEIGSFCQTSGAAVENNCTKSWSSIKHFLVYVSVVFLSGKKKRHLFNIFNLRRGEQVFSPGSAVTSNNKAGHDCDVKTGV